MLKRAPNNIGMKKKYIYTWCSLLKGAILLHTLTSKFIKLQHIVSSMYQNLLISEKSIEINNVM